MEFAGSWSVIVAFAALTLAVAALWAPLVSSAAHAARWWTFPFALALVAAAAGGLVDARGLVVLSILAGACIAANRARRRAARAAAHAIMLAACAALLLHVVPGFDNPRVLNAVFLATDSAPYTKYLNFDKGVVGLLLLGLYAPDRTANDQGVRYAPGVLWRFAVMTVVVMALALAIGYVRWDPKLPAWWPLWAWSIVVLTALPEEALFRGVVQEWVRRLLGAAPSATAVAVIVGGIVFGVAHVAGGLAYVVLATAAGIGYGWIYAATRSIGAAVLAHAGLNIVHFFFFSYPSLALP